MKQKMTRLLLSVVLAFSVVLVPVFVPHSLAQAAKSHAGVLKGTLRYATLKYWVETAKGQNVYLSVESDSPLEKKLMALTEQKVTLTGKYVTYPDKSRFFEVESITATSAAPFITVAGNTVQVNGEVVFQDEAAFSMSIKKSYKLAGKTVALVQVNSGGTLCPAEFVFVTVGTGGAATATEKFGNCVIPKISKKGGKITLAFPGNPPVTWTYANGKVVKKD
jgi:hypothetical protein